MGELTRELIERITADEARRAGAERLIGPNTLLALLERAAAGDGGSADGADQVDWFDDVSTPRHETAAEIVEAALAGALRRTVVLDGDEPARWNWGETHHADFLHPLGRATRLSRWFDAGPIGLPGDGETINVAIYSLSDPFRVIHIPSARLLFDLSGADRNLAILPTGESGHPFSTHYSDQLPVWACGDYRPAPLTWEAVRGLAVETLILTP